MHGDVGESAKCVQWTAKVTCYNHVQLITLSEHIAMWLILRCIDRKGLFQLHNTGHKGEVCRRYDCVSP